MVPDYLASLYYDLQQGLRELFPNDADSSFAIAIVKLRRGEFAFVIYRKDGVPIATFKVIAPEEKLFPLTEEDILTFLRYLHEYDQDCNVPKSSLERLIVLGEKGFFSCIRNCANPKCVTDATAFLSRWLILARLSFPKEIDPSA